MNPTTNNKPQLIEFDPRLIDPSPFQSRKEFDPAKLAELTESIREHGIIQPLVARYPKKVPLGGLERLELVAGERRMRAAIEAGLVLVPVLVSNISDATAEAMVLTENLQREGLTPSEEAHAFERLLQLKGELGENLYTQESLAKMISKDVEYIVARMKLLLCPEELVAAVNAGEVSVSTAMLIGRVPDAKARATCAKQVLTPELQQVPLNYAQTQELIREHFMVKLNKKEFDLDDANLVPVKLDEAGARCHGGACTDCPFRSGNLEGAEIQSFKNFKASRNSVTLETKAKGGASPNLCTLPRCHKMKLDAQWEELKLQAERGGKRTLDGAAAKKAFSGYNGSLAYDGELEELNGDVYLHDGTKEPKRALLKGRDVQVTLARHPDTHQVIELVLKSDVAAAKKAKAAGGGSPGESAQEENDAKERRANELRAQKIERIAVKEGTTEIREALASGRVKADEDLLERLFDCALDAAGADGLKFLADFVGIEREKKAGSYELDKPVKAWVKTNVTTAPQWLSIVTVTMLSRRVAWNGTDCGHFKAMLGLCGLKVQDLEKRAKTLLDAEKKGKGKVGKEEPKPAAKNSTDDSNWTADGVASTMAAADERAKSVQPLLGLLDDRKDAQKANDDLIQDFPGVNPDEDQTDLASPALCGSGPSVSEIVTGIQDTKIGKPGMWTPADVESGAKLLKAGTHKIADLIGPKPRKDDANGLRKWNAVRVQMLKKAKKLK